MTLENLGELVAVAREFADEPVAPPSEDPADLRPATPGVPEFLERVALVADSDQIPDADEDGGGVVTLMTLHTAKGLEFPVMVLAGVNAKFMPLPVPGFEGDPVGEADHVDRERSLLFVAATRARDLLIVTGWGTPCPFLPAP